MYPDTYSQFDEQQAIERATAHLPNDESSRFLDIGAWDPKCFSNSRALFERGWGGVLIEPSPGPLKSLITEYGQCDRVHVVSAAVFFEATVLLLQVTDDSVSTLQIENYKTWKEQAKFLGRLYVPTITPKQIFNQFGGFHFINIDAEGISVDLFHNIIGADARPDCFCVEHDGRLVELCDAATRAGYKLTYSNGTNAVFAR